MLSKRFPLGLFSECLTKTKPCFSISSRLTSTSTPADYIKTNLHNGVGRHVCQLQRVTLKFCKEHPNSLGIREFIEADLLDFARKNSGTVVYLQPKRHGRPKIFAEYLNGQTQTFDISMYTREQIIQWLEFHRTRNGNQIVRLMEPAHTENPSVQGVWTPYTNKPFEAAIRKYPVPNRLSADIKKTASQQILELFEKQKELEKVKNIAQVN